MAIARDRSRGARDDATRARATPANARARAMAIELDRLLGARDDATRARAVRSVEHAPDVSALGATARGARANASRMPDAFYAHGDALVMSHDAVVGVREASAGRWRLGEGEDAAYDAAATALCANGDHATAWNARKRAMRARFDGVERATADARERLVDDARDELTFARAVQSRFPKAPSAWAHRRWVIDAARAAVMGDGSKEDAWALETFREECRACDAAVLKKRLNYAAWSHRAWALKRLLPNRRELLDRELCENERRVRTSVSDHCALHYRSHIVKRALDARPADRRSIVLYEDELSRRLIGRYPGHEALWSYYRFVFDTMVRAFPRDDDVSASIKSFVHEQCDVDELVRVDPARAERDAPTQRRLALAFEIWMNVRVARERGESVVIKHTRATDGSTVEVESKARA